MSSWALSVPPHLASAAEAVNVPVPVAPELVVVGMLLSLLIFREVYGAYLGARPAARVRRIDIAVRCLMVAFVIIVGTRALELYH